MRDGNKVICFVRCPQHHVGKRQVCQQLAFPGHLAKPGTVIVAQSGLGKNGIDGGHHPFSVMRATASTEPEPQPTAIGGAAAL